MKKVIYILILLSLALYGCSTEEQLVNDYIITESKAVENIEENINIIENIDLQEDKSLTKENIAVSENQIVHEEKIDTALPKEITISFVGDCTVGTYKGQGTSGTYNEYYDNYGGDYFLENVRDIFKEDDITFVNLEGPITDKDTTVDKKFPISCKTEHVNVINNSSIEVCSIANNHTMDCGESGLMDTINILEENNIGYCGNGYIYRKNIDGVDISCLAYNGWSASDELLTSIKKDIVFERENGADIVCVMFHWGVERDNYSNETQQTIAYHAIDSGADIVVGGHPHVIQGIEQYNGKTIVYSLGNFTFGANKNPSDKDTFIFQQTFAISENTIDYGEYNIIPCSISSEINRNNYQPTPLFGTEADRVLDRIKKYSSGYNHNIF